MKTKIVRTRYAPSPTGLFHVGGARTALFNFLFARSNDGIFIVRIEDTDIERNIEGGIDSQFENLKWLKLFFDESLENPGLYGPYVQSEKLDIYSNIAMNLVENKHAYKCFCSVDELILEREEALRNKLPPKYSRKCSTLNNEQIELMEKSKIPWTVRLKISDEDIFEWEDLIRGNISIPATSMSDPIILKANKTPTYNFAVSIDDSQMEISHVLRGEEHISNTPYQIAISKLLDINKDIIYGHLPLIVNEDRKKLSKRDNSVKQFIEEYKNMGFTPESIINYLALLGWNPKNNIEIKDLITIINEFDIKDVSSSPSMFDFKKMEWVSKEHFKIMDNVSFFDFTNKFLSENNKKLHNIESVLMLFKNQISYAGQLNHLIEDFLRIDKISIKVLNENDIEINDDIIKLIHDLKREFSFVDDWTLDAVDEVLKSIKNLTSLKGKHLFLPIRLITTTKNSGPELLKVIYLLGMENVKNNIDNFKIFIETYNKAIRSGEN